jgi:hypothetical protein
MQFLIIEKTRIGYKIKNDSTGAAVHYIGCSARRAENTFRIEFNLRYKHFTKIYI